MSVTMRQMLEAGCHLVTKPVSGPQEWPLTFSAIATKFTSST